MLSLRVLPAPRSMRRAAGLVTIELTLRGSPDTTRILGLSIGIPEKEAASWPPPRPRRYHLSTAMLRRANSSAPRALVAHTQPAHPRQASTDTRGGGSAPGRAPAR